jgi:riboflavin kinase/FMN adenylyltransferase
LEIHTEYRNLHALYPKIVVGIGNFDGVHLGHRELIGRLVTYADRIGGTPTVLTFDPHPLTVLKPDTPLPLLLPPNAKQEFLARLGIRVMVQVCLTLRLPA